MAKTGTFAAIHPNQQVRAAERTKTAIADLF